MSPKYEDVKSKVDSLRNTFWSGGISNPLTALEQITYLLFLRQLDEIYTDDKHPLPPNLRWKEMRHLPPNLMFERMQNETFLFLRGLPTDISTFPTHMRNAAFVIPTPPLLFEVFHMIDNICATFTGYETQGDFYEYLLSDFVTAGKSGQFCTPRHIIDLIANLVQPKIGQRIIDPACGSGGFLVGAYKYMTTGLNKRLDEDHQELVESTLIGYDIDSTMVRIGLMNLIMHGFKRPCIDYMDTLDPHFEQDGLYDFVMTNPPFAGSIDRWQIHPAALIETSRIELLFVENCYRLLKKGGKAGIIVPLGTLFTVSQAHKAIRSLLIERCNLQAVITMPSGVFKPYTGINTAILIFTKVFMPSDRVDRPATDFVWFYEMEADGFSLDAKRLPLERSDVSDIISKFNARDPRDDTDRSQKCFVVSREEIEHSDYSLSMSRYKIDVVEESVYEDPMDIINQLLQTEIGAYEEMDLSQVNSGIVKELMDLKELISR